MHWPKWKRIEFCLCVAVGSVLLTVAMGHVRLVQMLNLKVRDAHFVLRGKRPVQDIVLIGIDNKALNTLPELYAFWHPYYAEAVRAAALGGARVFTLDVTFQVPVTKWEPENDSLLAAAVTEVSSSMPIVCGFVPGTTDQQRAALFAVPVNMLASALGLSAFANLTSDPDDFIRRQELLELPDTSAGKGGPLLRGMALRTAEKFLGQDAALSRGEVRLAGRRIPLGAENDMVINFAGPAGTFPRVSLADFITAYRARDQKRLEQWVKGKAVLLGPDNKTDRYSTPFFTFFEGNDWQTAGVEIHANTLGTILSGAYLRELPQSARALALILASAFCVALVTAGGTVPVTALWSAGALFVFAALTHVLFLMGWLLSTSEIFMSGVLALFCGVVYRFATAEKKSTFFRSAVALFVGKQVVRSPESTQRLALTGQRRFVTILFTDIRGFTAFCEAKDPAVVVDLLNAYMKTMVGIICRHGGHVNKFIGDGILAVFSDDDEGASAGDHALRATECAAEMVTAECGDFKTGAGLHSGDVVIGNVGSQEKMEFTVLGDTVNLASRLESLNKEHKTKLLLSEATREMIVGQVDTHCLGTVPVRGKSLPMSLYTVTSLMESEKPEREESVPAKAEAIR